MPGCTPCMHGRLQHVKSQDCTLSLLVPSCVRVLAATRSEGTPREGRRMLHHLLLRTTSIAASGGSTITINQKSTVSDTDADSWGASWLTSSAFLVRFNPLSWESRPSKAGVPPAVHQSSRRRHPLLGRQEEKAAHDVCGAGRALPSTRA